MVSAADEDALDRADVAVVTPPGDRNMRIAGEAIVGGIEVDPAERSAPARRRRVRGIGTDEASLAGRSCGSQMAARVSCGQSHRTQAARGQMGKVLANSAA